MPALWGERLTRRELLARVGDVGQVGGVRRVRLTEGVEAGVEAVELRTGAGLDLEVLPSRGLDLGAARFEGRPLVWLSAAGFSHPGLVESRGEEGFLRAFGGGLLTTAGLSNVGKPSREGDREFGLHGRASSTPAREVAAWGEWEGDEYVMTVRGRTREAVLYGEKLDKTRTLTARLGEARVRLVDRVENLGFEPAPVLLLYHLNLGWPLVRPGSRLELPSLGTEPVLGDPAGWAEPTPPDPTYATSVLEHRLAANEDGWTRLALVSPDVRLELAYDARTLPRFTQWRMLGAGDYVLGLEPGTVGVGGRPAELARGGLPTLEPGEAREFRLELAVARA